MVKQKNLLKNIASNKFKTARAAAIDAGYSRQVTDKGIARAIQSAQHKYLKALVRAGATDSKSARVISEAMDAEKEVFNDDGEVIESNKDHQTRLKANEQYLKVKKLIGVNEEEGAAPRAQATLIINMPGAKKESEEPKNGNSRRIRLN